MKYLGIDLDSKSVKCENVKFRFFVISNKASTLSVGIWNITLTQVARVHGNMKHKSR